MDKENNNKDNQNQDNNKKGELENEIYIDDIPDLTLDVLCAIRQITRLAVDRQCFDKKEMDTIEKVLHCYNIGVDKLVLQFQRANPEITDQIVNQHEEKQKQVKTQKLDSIPEEIVISGIKNGCDASDGDIQG